MRISIFLAFAALVTLAGSAAKAEPQFLDYNKPDAGTLVISFSTTGLREVGCLVELVDGNGSSEFTSEPRKSQNDFTEQFDAAGFVKGLNAPGVISDKTDFYGRLELIKLPPGKYRFLSCSANYGVYYSPSNNDKGLSDITFEIQTGRATYVGGFRFIDLSTRGAFGMTVTNKYLVQRVDSATRDLGIAQRVGVNVTDPLITPVPK